MVRSVHHLHSDGTHLRKTGVRPSAFQGVTQEGPRHAGSGIQTEVLRPREAPRQVTTHHPPFPGSPLFPAFTYHTDLAKTTRCPPSCVLLSVPQFPTFQTPTLPTSAEGLQARGMRPFPPCGLGPPLPLIPLPWCHGSVLLPATHTPHVPW